METRFLTLVGLKHVGKSSVARELASSIGGAVLVDIDDEMIRQAQHEGWFHPPTAGGAPQIRELYRFMGLPAFATWEATVIERTIALTHPFCILATGGGVCDNSAAMELLQISRPIVYLYDDPAILYERIIRRGVPAFLDQSDPETSFRQIADRRDQIYRTQADAVITVTGLSVEQAARQIQQLLERGQYGRQ